LISAPNLSISRELEAHDELLSKIEVRGMTDINLIKILQLL